MKKESLLRLVAAVGVCELSGLIGSIFTAPSIPIWYAALAKPSFSPPNWVFGPVWTTLFALMGAAVWLVAESKSSAKSGRRAVTKEAAIGLFAAQLGLNVGWSLAFFGLHAIGWAFIELCVLWIAVLGCIVVFSRFSKAAAWLLVPYLLWISFAGALNFSLWGLNGGYWQWQRLSVMMPAAAVPESGEPAIDSPLPFGYSAKEYEVEKMTGDACRQSSDCETPVEYLLMSRCPFASVCLKGQCAVVCPRPAVRPSAGGMMMDGIGGTVSQ